MSSEVVGLVQALVWPLSLAIVALVLKAPLAALVDSMRGKIKSLKVAGVELAFNEASEPKRELQLSSELRKGTGINESSVDQFVAEVTSTQPLEHVVIDLGTGQEWITSRLFLVATLLHRMREVKIVTFVGTLGKLDRYVGQCEVEQLRWRLARRFAWFETTLMDAEQDAWRSGNVAITTDTGRLESTVAGIGQTPAAAILTGFIQRNQNPPAPGNPEWVDLGMGKWEHARWLTGETLVELLGDALDRTLIDTEAFKASSNAAKIKTVLDQAGPLVAFGSRDRKFEAVLDRTRWLESIARQSQ
jgi:hypothetical protein